MDSKLGIEDWLRLLNAFRASLRVVKLSEIVLVADQWVDLLRALQSLHLDRLYLCCANSVLGLHVWKVAAYEQGPFNEHYAKWFKGERSWEHYIMRGDYMGTLGERAVQAGLLYAAELLRP